MERYKPVQERSFILDQHQIKAEQKESICGSSRVVSSRCRDHKIGTS